MELTKSDIRTLVKVLNAFAGSGSGYVSLDILDEYKEYYIAVLDHIEKVEKEQKNRIKPEDVDWYSLIDPDELREQILAEYEQAGMREIVKLIFLLSQKYVPVDTGFLRDSGWIECHEDDTYTIHYDAPYAAKQHETMEYNHDPPGRAKYLEDAAYEIMAWLSDKKPLFTFELGLGEGGNIWLEIDTIDAEEFVRNNEYKERIRALD